MNRRAISIPFALACLAGIAAAAIAIAGASAPARRTLGAGPAARAAQAATRTRGATRASGGATRASASATGASASATRASGGATASRVSAPRPPGSLPQTATRPSADTAQFHAQMRALWAGIVAGSLAPALPAFFPRGAYGQLKAIPGAGADWRDRLVYDYRLDIGAAHALLEGDSGARLIAVDVPSSYAHWVPPGVCYNGVGYFEVPNARVVYRTHGVVRSFGLASMISWRGVWYVVHLGAILRSSNTGQVLEPSSGRGSSGYSGTC
jgi:hypothetical protein